MGNHLSFLQVSFLPIPAPTWTAADIPDLTGAVVLVTGGNAGLGFECAKELLAKNAKVYIAARNREKTDAAIQVLKNETGKEAHFLQLDLSDLKSVRAAAVAFIEQESALHILINNAGVMAPPIDQTTADGFDLQFGTNVIGHHLFSVLLHPALRAGGRTAPAALGGARVVHLSSVAAYAHASLDFASFIDGPARRRKGSSVLYLQSKFGNVVHAREMARRWAADGIVSLAVHPGIIESDLWQHLSRVGRLFWTRFFYSLQLGALTPLYAAAAPAAARLADQPVWLVPWGRVRALPAGADDAALGRRLWEWLEDATAEAESDGDKNTLAYGLGAF